VSRRLGVDVLLALDRAGASEEAAALDGYQWQGGDGWGPLAPAQDYINHRLLGPERLLDELPRDSWVLPDWAAEDPLDDLFRVWFGAYGTSAQGVSLEKQFAARATQARIDDGAEVPADPASWITPITATHGNPLALLELVRGLTPDQLAGGFGLPGAARRASENHAELGHTNWAVAELVEAAARSGMTETAAGAYRRLAEMTGASGTDWGPGRPGGRARC